MSQICTGDTWMIHLTTLLNHTDNLHATKRENCAICSSFLHSEFNSSGGQLCFFKLTRLIKVSTKELGKILECGMSYFLVFISAELSILIT